MLPEQNSTPVHPNALGITHWRLGKRAFRIIRRAVKASRKMAKSGLARIVYSLPYLSKRDPRRSVITCREQCQTVEKFAGTMGSVNRDWSIAVRPGEILVREPSMCLDDHEATRFKTESAKFQLGDRFETPAAFLTCFHRAKIEATDFLIVSHENRIIFESALSDQGVLERNGILDRLWPYRVKRLRGAHILLAHHGADTYYHWIIEALPKLSLIQEFSQLASVPLIVPKTLNAFQRDSLKMLGVPSERLLGLDDGQWQTDQLFFPESIGRSGNPSRHAVRWLRKAFLTNDYRPDSAFARIYITRRDAPRRRLANEAEIVSYLQGIGFTVVCLGDLAFAEQIELFRNVRVVIAPHGAGLTNMVFASPGATIIEIFGDNYINGCYWALASLCGHRHAFLTTPAQALDYSLSLERLKALLKRVEPF